MMTTGPDYDSLAEWISVRDRQYRVAGSAWAGVTIICGVLSLMSDSLLLLPLLPLLAAALWLAGAWVADRWWRARCGWAGHPVVHADAAWTTASDRPLPPGWRDAPVVGELHRTPGGWMWRPSRLLAAKVHAVSWDAGDVAVVTVTPLWSPLAPPVAQVRLYLRSGRTVDLRVRQPARLMPT